MMAKKKETFDFTHLARITEDFVKALPKPSRVSNKEWSKYKKIMRLDLETHLLKNLCPKSLCGKCGNEKAEAKHPCPYDADRYGDEKKKCNCCASCETACVYDL